MRTSHGTNSSRELGTCATQMDNSLYERLGDIGTCNTQMDISLYQRSRGHRDIRTSHCTNASGDIGTCDTQTDISLYEQLRGHRDM